ncbi:MAG: RES family NAD+ phosphorylase [Fuerstiella sp.]
MKLQAFRIVKARLAGQAFTGEGARRYGGRWNRPGSLVVYVASTRSLAMLEMLVHLQARQLLLSYVVFPVEFDDSLVTDVDRQSLPRDWRSSPVALEVQQIGDRWIASGVSPALRVPSVIVDSEFNYLLNPAHPKFSRITIGKKQPIIFDPRLK